MPDDINWTLVVVWVAFMLLFGLALVVSVEFLVFIAKVYALA